ncbi:tRNA G46 methylase TrmB [Primorskyibacter sedentarius]|uniref:tRNA (guanine(46)-N(7))-methyltransferase n=1 Tax=Primorskyibacter sedentarius TaxID=745311 RepID=A0A4R3J440_9RHOB|nr:tRNA G46 methylase TrmB [Primorskyibacter sedentarius]
MLGNIELDIGCGRGTFIARIAREKPNTVFVGIDINEDNANASQERIARDCLSNAIIAHDEAENFITRNVQDDSLAAAHIYFPTPYVTGIKRTNILGSHLSGWLLTERFLLQLHTKCRAGAILRIVTDHRSYFKNIASSVASSSFVETPWVNPIRSSTFDNLVGTGLEKRQRSRGKYIYFLQAVA